MCTLDASPSDNGRGSDAWSQGWTHLSVDRRSLAYCRVTFDQPPLDAVTATTVAELSELVGLIEEDPDLKVVVFDSANPDFDLPHHDVRNDPAWLNLLVRLSRAPVVSIASIRGRVRGAANEFVKACDLRLHVADDQLDDEVEEIASRLARFDHHAIATSCVDQVTPDS